MTQTALPFFDTGAGAGADTGAGVGADAAVESVSDMLAAVRERRSAADRAEAEILEFAVRWADMHPAESIGEAATHRARGFGDTPIPVAGQGRRWLWSSALRSSPPRWG
jgi:hypothetical protein